MHTFVNTGGDVRELDFRFFVGDKKIGAPFHGLKAFFTTPQLSVLDKVRLLTCCQQEDSLSCMYSLRWSSAAYYPYLDLLLVLLDPLEKSSNLAIAILQGSLRVAFWRSSSVALQSGMVCGTVGPELSGAGDLTSCQGPL